MPENLDTRFDPKEIEDKIYGLWEKSGYFNPENLPVAKNPKPRLRQGFGGQVKAKSFSIIMPPPNANGPLHLGHAVFVTLQDIMIRYWRMRGKKTLWLPGADHAGFETQVVFDKKLDKEGRNRFEMDRETLFREIWDFTQKNKKIMEDQLRKLGASCDWSREKFTLDPAIVKIVNETFQKLYEDGLAYRGIRIVNWCPKHRTALSDLEVKYIERTDPLYYIKYGPLVSATVRPETKFGDTALAINPKDKRYKKYIGQEIEINDILGKKKLKVVADDAVDPKFGTGVVKVTPAHDPADFEIWQRHQKEIPGPKVVIDESGRLTGDVGEFKGMKTAEARGKTVEAMEKIGILEKIVPDYVHQVSTCYKCGSILEPLPKPQWFIRMTTKPTFSKKQKAKRKSLQNLGIDAVKSGKIKFYPDRTKKIYFHWLKNLRDWNISRQIIWGIRIPAWYCLICRKPKINFQPKSKWFLVRHGEINGNKEMKMIGQIDESLNETGKKQAETAAEKLSGHKIDLIISSDLSRCRETAEIISRKTGAEIILEKNFRERDHGESEGMLRDEAALKYGNLYTYEPYVDGSEGYRQVEERAWKALQEHKKVHHHKNVVIVTHGGVIRALSKPLRNLTVEQMLAMPMTKNGEIFQMDIGEKCGECGNDLYEQDKDVFDTWFSSGQWPFATLMTTNPNKKDFKTFYPTDVMETGYDILFFWVARMIMLGLYRTGKIPFKNIYLHGLVLDKDKQKMSKSKGNVIDPLAMAEIYGSDALRMALVVGNTAGRDIVISEEKIKGYRNFATKIWNIARFILINKPEQKIKNRPQTTAVDKKHLKELQKIKSEMEKHIEKFEFHLAAEKIYHYIWHNFADKIIEEYKPRLQNNSNDALVAYQTLETIFLECLKILHPFMPFVSEEIHQKFSPIPTAGKSGKILMTEQW